MSRTVTFARINHDGTLMRVPSEGSEEALPAEPIAPMMREQVNEAVPQGPDAQPLSTEDAQPMHLKPPHVASLRRALFLTQPLAITSRSLRYAIGSGSSRNQISRCAPISPSSRATPR